jgi:hypothetical protein
MVSVNWGEANSGKTDWKLLVFEWWLKPQEEIILFSEGIKGE